MTLFTVRTRQAVVLREPCLCRKKRDRRANPGERNVEEYEGKAVGKEWKKLGQKTWKRAGKTIMDSPLPVFEESGMLARTYQPQYCLSCP